MLQPRLKVKESVSEAFKNMGVYKKNGWTDKGFVWLACIAIMFNATLVFCEGKFFYYMLKIEKKKQDY